MQSPDKHNNPRRCGEYRKLDIREMQFSKKHNSPRQRNKHRKLCVLLLHFSYKHSSPRQHNKHRNVGVCRLQRSYKHNLTRRRDEYRTRSVQELRFTYKYNSPRQRDNHRRFCVLRLHQAYRYYLQRNIGAMGRCCKTLFMGYKHKRLHNTLHRRRYNKKLKYLHFLSIFFRHGDLKTARKTRRFSVLSKNRTIPHSKSNLPIRKAKPRLKTSLKRKKLYNKKIAHSATNMV